MAFYDHIQMRFPKNEVVEGMTFQFRGRQYTIGPQVPETMTRDGLPIGVVMTGYTCQFAVLSDGQKAGEAWFYFYRSIGDPDWGVLDMLTLHQEDTGPYWKTYFRIRSDYSGEGWPSPEAKTAFKEETRLLFEAYGSIHGHIETDRGLEGAA